MYLVSISACYLFLQRAYGLNNGLGRVPPIAWSSWNFFALDINASVIEAIADTVESSGLVQMWTKLSGVRPSLNIDAGYLEHDRSSSGKLVVNSTKFPYALSQLSDSLSSKGLGMGVYTDISNRSCGLGPGSLGFYHQDAEQIASEWKASYLKVDYCGYQVVSPEPVPQYEHWVSLRDALNATGKPIYYSICPHTQSPDVGPGRAYQNFLSYAPPASWTAEQRQKLANSLLVEFVNTLDFWYSPHSYGGTTPPGGIITNIDSWASLTEPQYAVPGSHNDLDMLQMCMYGKGATPHGEGMTLSEYRAHYSVWVVLGSPIILSADFRTLAREHPDCMSLLMNEAVLAVNQDAGMHAARMVSQTTNSSDVTSATITQQVFARPLDGVTHGGHIHAMHLAGKVQGVDMHSDGTARSLAVVFLNRGESREQSMSVSWEELGLPAGRVVQVVDIWSGEHMGSAVGSVNATVSSHDVLMLRLDGASVDLNHWGVMPRVPANT